jgi:hypothetical protein
MNDWQSEHSNAIWLFVISNTIWPGYRRIELASKSGTIGAYRCLVCDRAPEVFEGKTEVASRL